MTGGPGRPGAGCRAEGRAGTRGTRLAGLPRRRPATTTSLPCCAPLAPGAYCTLLPWQSTPCSRQAGPTACVAPCPALPGAAPSLRTSGSLSLADLATACGPGTWATATRSTVPCGRPRSQATLAACRLEAAAGGPACLSPARCPFNRRATPTPPPMHGRPGAASTRQASLCQASPSVQPRPD